ncbi:hypothetical protein HK098_001289, partial [Nowakowskiella sp. JEL0407]
MSDSLPRHQTLPRTHTVNYVRPGSSLSNLTNNANARPFKRPSAQPVSPPPNITLDEQVEARTGCNPCAPCTPIYNRLVDMIVNPDIDDVPILEAFDKLDDYVKVKACDAELYPELKLNATIRTRNEISEQEKAYRASRLQSGRTAFAKFIGVPEHEVDVRDVPVVGAAGSGGGFKAMISTAGYLKGMKEAGIYDFLVYLSGVSGSCWTISNLFCAADCDPHELIQHFKRILVNHPADPAHVSRVLLQDVENRVELAFGGLSIKYYDNVPRGIVDAFGTLLFAHFMSDQPEKWNVENFKLSVQAKSIEAGKAPMPLYTATRQERPWDDKDEGNTLERKRDAEIDPWWQWFELSPYEIGCDELRAWCPTYAFGRTFENGQSVNAVPEQSFSLIVGLIASAMSAPFTTTFETLERAESKGFFGDLTKKFATQILRPDAASWIKRLLSNSIFEGAINRNFIKGLPPAKVRLTTGEIKELHLPSDFQNDELFELIDAGADNNQALYPLVRPSRNVDVAFVFDASVDVEQNITTPDLERFGKRRGFAFTRTTPEPPQVVVPENGTLEPLKGNPELIKTRYANRFCQVFEGVPTNKGQLGEHNEPMADHDLTVLYMPVLPNPKSADFEPSTKLFTQLVYAEDETEGLSNTAYLNMMDSIPQIKETLKSVWLKKRAARLSSE